MIIFMMADESWPCITHPGAPLMLAWLGAVEHGTQIMIIIFRFKQTQEECCRKGWPTSQLLNGQDKIHLEMTVCNL